MKIRVRVFLRTGRKCFEAQWSDPVTGRKRTRTTGLTTRKEAVRFAAKLEVELESGSGPTFEKITWEEFRKRYEEEVLAALRIKTRQKARSTLNAVEAHIQPKYLLALTSAVVSKFQSCLRATGAVEPTIKSHLSCLRAALRWGFRMGYLKEVPSFNMPAKTTGMKGRPITREEFERLQAQTVAVVGAELAADWANDLEGLWWSGLRLGEATILHWWDDRQLAVDLTGRRPMFRIQAASEKGGRFRMLPMAPEFAEWLQRQPEDRRSGFVFQFRSSEGLDRLSTDWVSKLISRMGEKASVKVSERRKVQEGKPVDEIKYASAHDFRRAFGYRWSTRVMPPVLMEMMRHASITTTMEFYVGRNAEAAADQIWQAFANETANSRATQEQRERRPESKDIA